MNTSAQHHHGTELEEMRHPLPADLAWVDDVLDEWPCTLRWDVRGLTPSVPSLVSRLWDDVATHRVGLDGDGRPCGLVQLVDMNLVNRTARLEAVLRPGPEAANLLRGFIEEIFRDFPLRLTHTFAATDAMDVGQLVPEATEVGRLPQYCFRGGGRYEDVVIHEVTGSRR
jgi:hypothetical protein